MVDFPVSQGCRRLARSVWLCSRTTIKTLGAKFSSEHHTLVKPLQQQQRRPGAAAANNCSNTPVCRRILDGYTASESLRRRFRGCLGHIPSVGVVGTSSPNILSKTKANVDSTTPKTCGEAIFRQSFTLFYLFVYHLSITQYTHKVGQSFVQVAHCTSLHAAHKCAHIAST